MYIVIELENGKYVKTYSTFNFRKSCVDLVKELKN